MTFLEVNHEFPISKYFDKIDLFFDLLFWIPPFELNHWSNPSAMSFDEK